MRIWTEAYRPFIMGGDCSGPVACDIPVNGPFDLGKGYEGYLAVSPRGKTFVAESQTGAIVGSTVESVCTDIEAADEAVMEEQIARAKERSKKASTVSPRLFWKLLRAD